MVPHQHRPRHPPLLAGPSPPPASKTQANHRLLRLCLPHLLPHRLHAQNLHPARQLHKVAHAPLRPAAVLPPHLLRYLRHRVRLRRPARLHGPRPASGHDHMRVHADDHRQQRRHDGAGARDPGADRRRVHARQLPRALPDAVAVRNVHQFRRLVHGRAPRRARRIRRDLPAGVPAAGPVALPAHGRSLPPLARLC